MIYQIGICDDENSTCSELENILIDYFKVSGLNVQVNVWNCAEDFMRDVPLKVKVDLLFLDIELPNYNGIYVGELVLHPSEGCGAELHTLTGGPQQAGPRRRSRPLGGGRADSAVAQRRAELTFCRTEMAGRHGQQAVGHACTAQRRAEAQRFGHRAAGPEEADKGDAQLPQGVAGRGTLGL